MSAALSVSLTAAQKVAVFAFTSNCADGDTVVIGDHTYTFETGTLDAAFKVNVGADLDESITNLVAAINLGGTIGTDYATGTTLNPYVVAAADTTNDEVDLTPRIPGVQANGLHLAATSPGANDITANAAALGLITGTDSVGSIRSYIAAIATDGLQPNSAILAVLSEFAGLSSAEA
jgi:hypothetical protein